MPTRCQTAPACDGSVVGCVVVVVCGWPCVGSRDSGRCGGAGLWSIGRQVGETRLLIGRCRIRAWPGVDPAIIGFNSCRQPRAASDAADHAFLATFTNHCPSPSPTPTQPSTTTDHALAVTRELVVGRHLLCCFLFPFFLFSCLEAILFNESQSWPSRNREFRRLQSQKGRNIDETKNRP